MARDRNSIPQIESLQIDLLRLACYIGSAEKDLAVDAIRCVLLSHIAALEAADAILQSLTCSPALISSLSVDALEALEEATETIPRQKPD